MRIRQVVEIHEIDNISVPLPHHERRGSIECVSPFAEHITFIDACFGPGDHIIDVCAVERQPFGVAVLDICPVRFVIVIDYGKFCFELVFAYASVGKKVDMISGNFHHRFEFLQAVAVRDHTDLYRRVNGFHCLRIRDAFFGILLRPEPAVYFIVHLPVSDAVRLFAPVLYTHPAAFRRSVSVAVFDPERRLTRTFRLVRKFNKIAAMERCRKCPVIRITIEQFFRNVIVKAFKWMIHIHADHRLPACCLCVSSKFIRADIVVLIASPEVRI